MAKPSLKKIGNFKAVSRDNDEVIHKKHRHKQRAASLLACESLTQSKRADELISGSLIKGKKQAG
jgi:hypothetical protein